MNIKELYEQVKRGNVDEKDLFIQLDNDSTWVGMKHGEDIEKIAEGGGYDDLNIVFELLFPKAEVEWV